MYSCINFDLLSSSILIPQFHIDIYRFIGRFIAGVFCWSPINITQWNFIFLAFSRTKTINRSSAILPSSATQTGSAWYLIQDSMKSKAIVMLRWILMSVSLENLMIDLISGNFTLGFYRQPLSNYLGQKNLTICWFVSLLSGWNITLLTYSPWSTDNTICRASNLLGHSLRLVTLLDRNFYMPGFQISTHNQGFYWWFPNREGYWYIGIWLYSTQTASSFHLWCSSPCDASRITWQSN